MVVETSARANSVLAGGLPVSLEQKHLCWQLRTQHDAGCMQQSGEECDGAGREGATSSGRVGWLGQQVGWPHDHSGHRLAVKSRT